MGITLNWDNEQQTIILIEYERPWNWDDFDQTAHELINMMGQVDHTVHIIFDISHAGMPPGGAMTRFKRVMQIEHPNRGQLVFISTPALTTFIRLVRHALNKIDPGDDDTPPFEFVQTLAEARTSIIGKPDTQVDFDDTDAPI